MKKFLNKLFDWPLTDKYGYPVNSIIIDVSLRKDYETAHLNEAVSIPIGIINEMVDVLKTYDKTIVIISNSKNLSEIAYNILLELGIPAYNGGDWTKSKNVVDYYKNPSNANF
jgi:rhodanese-related sulfurtransferase